MTYGVRSFYGSNQSSNILPKRQGQRDQLLRFLSRDGSNVVYERNYEHHRGVLRIQPSQEITDLFDIRREIPILIATYPNLDARILNRFNDRDLRGAVSADKDIAVLVAADDRADGYVRKGRHQFGYPILTVHIGDLIQGRYSDATLSSEIAKLLRTVNHFDYSKDIQNDADFFGREGDRQAILSSTVIGQNIGIFGLRRAGKTSLMRQLSSELLDRDTESIFVPLNQVNDADDLRVALVEATGRTVQRRMDRTSRTARSAIDSRMLNEDLSIDVSALADVETFRRQWIYEINSLLDQLDAEAVFMVDEIDFANEEVMDREEGDVDSTYATRREMYLFLRTLRGFIQKREDRGCRQLSLMVAGISSSIFSRSQLFGLHNQFFGFGSIWLLGPMEQEEMKQMVNVLGKRSGIRFDDELLDELYEEYGGLPHLTRQACARMADDINRKPLREVPYCVTREDLESVFSSMAEGSPSQAADETLRSFAECYPSEGREIEVAIREERSVDPRLIPQAIGFGLCDEEGQVRINALFRRRRAWNQYNSPYPVELMKLLQTGETENVEFKASARWSFETDRRDKALEHVIIKSVCGFLNASGGTLLVGVRDDGSIVGLDADMHTLSTPNRDGYERFLRQLIENGISVTTAGVVEISFEAIQGLEICVIEVSENAKPVFAKARNGGSHTEFYVRMGNSTKKLEGDAFVDYQATRWGS